MMKGVGAVAAVLILGAGQEAEQVSLTGELKEWHKITLSLRGPSAREEDADPNPFTDYRFTVAFAHESGSPRHEVPGYFAADGRAAETSAAAGDVWRAHLSPDKAGTWTATVSFVRGRNVALDPSASGEKVASLDGITRSFRVAPTDKTGRDFRSRGRLQYVGKHHLRFAGTGEYFLKAGPDAPETLLAYADFDGTSSGPGRKARAGEAAPTRELHRYDPHLRDWKEGDPAWKGGRGRSLIGALNYLASKGLNAFSFLPYNAGGDGDNVWPFIHRDAKFHYDCSKLDQWGIVFDHATTLGLYLHFKLQETEMDDRRVGDGSKSAEVPPALDGGALGPERRLYLRELVARFGHALALNWNLGEENTQTPEEQRDMARYLRQIDPYDHLIVIHTFPNQQDKVYPPLLGERSDLTGVSLQNGWNEVHRRTLQWIRASAGAGKPWVVANDEQNPAGLGVPPDPGYAGFEGKNRKGELLHTIHDIRKRTLWGNLMAGGAGVEYYFGYELPQNDLACEDFRSRDRSWDFCRIALSFFRDHSIPFWDMRNVDPKSGSSWVLARRGEAYLVYLPDGGPADLDLTGTEGNFAVSWFNPREGGPLRSGAVPRVEGGSVVSLGEPPADPKEDWVVLVRR